MYHQNELQIFFVFALGNRIDLRIKFIKLIQKWMDCILTKKMNRAERYLHLEPLCTEDILEKIYKSPAIVSF